MEPRQTVKAAPEQVSEHGRGESGPGAHSYRPPSPQASGEQVRQHRRQEVARFARTLVGIHETPTHSNDGPGVQRIQAATGQYRAPWCVSTVQYEDLHGGVGSTYANDTASAYYYADYAAAHDHVVSHPVIGCAVVYHLGAGHAGRVVSVNADGTFQTVEGNEGDAVRLMHRDPRVIRCTFILRPELAL